MTSKTVLHAKHLESSAKMVDFHGWEMPINYGSQIEEHHAVRQDAGMFDVSHMTIVDVKGDLIVATAKPKNVSARNILYGRVSRLKSMGISFLITVDIEPKLGLDVELTPESIDRHGITEGSKIFLMLKSSRCTINKY